MRTPGTGARELSHYCTDRRGLPTLGRHCAVGGRGGGARLVVQAELGGHLVRVSLRVRVRVRVRDRVRVRVRVSHRPVVGGEQALARLVSEQLDA